MIPDIRIQRSVSVQLGLAEAVPQNELGFFLVQTIVSESEKRSLVSVFFAHDAGYVWINGLKRDRPDPCLKGQGRSAQIDDAAVHIIIAAIKTQGIVTHRSGSATCRYPVPYRWFGWR